MSEIQQGSRVRLRAVQPLVEVWMWPSGCVPRGTVARYVRQDADNGEPDLATVVLVGGSWALVLFDSLVKRVHHCNHFPPLTAARIPLVCLEVSP